MKTQDNKSVPDLPIDRDAEQFVLGGIFAASAENPGCFPAVAEVLNEAMFSIEKHRLLFGAMRTVYARGMRITYEAVRHELGEKDALRHVGPFLDLAECAELVNLGGYCQAVAECFRLRQLYTKASDLQSRALSRDRSDDIIADAQKSFGQIETSLGDDDGQDPEEIVALAGGVNRFFAPENELGLMTPHRRLNFLTNGMRPGDLFVLGAKPGIGKTSVACGIAVNTALNGHLVRIESYEMLAKDLLFRMTCSHAKVDSQEARAGRLVMEDRRRLQTALSELVEAKQYLKISTKLRTAAGIARHLRRQRGQGRPVRLLIIDYLQKMHAVGKFERREQEVSQIAVGLKDIAVEYELSVLALAQLNVDAREQFNQPPTMDDFRESKAIGQEADVAIILRLKDAEQLYQPCRFVNWYVVKQRSGRTGKIPFYFHAKYCRYEEIPEEAREVP